MTRLRLVARIAAVAVAVPAGLWGLFVAGYTLPGPPWLRWTAGCVVLAATGCGAALASGRSRLRWLTVVPFAVALGWFACLSPDGQGPWEPEYAQAPTAALQGDTLVLHGMRSTRWSAGGVAAPDYHVARFDLAALATVDLVVSYWAGDTIAHVFLSFGFGDGRHLAVSAETRRRLHQPYSALAGFFRAYPLIYVAADEQDLIGVRTDIRRETVYLYRLRAGAAARRRLLLDYAGRMNAVAARPEFYNTLVNNCTTNVVQAARGGARDIPASWMLVLSGYADEYAYRLGELDRTMPFPELKRRSRIERAPGAMPGPDYPAEIRVGLPLPPD